MEILQVSASNDTEISTLFILLNNPHRTGGNDVDVRFSSSVFKAICLYFKLKDIFKASIKELKKTMNIQDTLDERLWNMSRAPRWRVRGGNPKEEQKEGWVLLGQGHPASNKKGLSSGSSLLAEKNGVLNCCSVV
ncbi:hypothetical protein Tco_1481239 [Tanacetum coccineum]